MIEDAQMKYISALDCNQITSCGVSLEPFKELEIDKAAQTVPHWSGFKKYNDQLYFEAAVLIGNKRYVFGLNRALFEEDRKDREEKLAHFKAYCDKTKNKDVFKNVKSFLKLRPFFVNTNAHVKAVYTICILAYFINGYLGILLFFSI